MKREHVDAYVLAHPVRKSIIRLLRDSDGLSIRQISEALAISQELVSFHVLALQSNEFVKEKWVFSNLNPLRNESRFRLTGKVGEPFGALSDQFTRPS